MSVQLPQQAPAPVRMVSSAMEPQPASAAWRMSLSVTPLQMQMYTALGSGSQPGRCGPDSIKDENDCQLTDPLRREPGLDGPGKGRPPRASPTSCGSGGGTASEPAMWRANGARCRNALA